MKADLAAGLALTALALAMSLGEGAQALLVPLATLPVIWRRRAPDLCALVTAIGIVATAGLPRCGAVIPAALLVLYASRGPLAPALVLGALTVLALSDPIIDAAALEFILPLAAGVWGAGRLVRSRERVASELATRSDELERERERTAALAVALERTRVSGELDDTVRERTRRLIELAEHGAYADIERLARATLNDVRDLLGALRSDLQPSPTLAQLERLLGDRLAVEGEPRAVPDSVELAAYRIVEHALATQRPVEVALRYRADGLELEVNGA